MKLPQNTYSDKLLYPPRNEVVGGVYWFHSVRPSVPRPSRIPCPLCSFYSSGWIHFIFIHLIKELQKVCRVQSFLQNFKIWNFLKFVTSDFVLFWPGIWCESLVWVIMGRRGVSQNAGVLVVLVGSGNGLVLSGNKPMLTQIYHLWCHMVWIIRLQWVKAVRMYQAGKLKIFGTRPNWVVSYIAYKKFHSPIPVFHSPGQIFTRIGEWASASFPACVSVITDTFSLDGKLFG